MTRTEEAMEELDRAIKDEKPLEEQRALLLKVRQAALDELAKLLEEHPEFRKH